MRTTLIRILIWIKSNLCKWATVVNIIHESANMNDTDKVSMRYPEKSLTPNEPHTAKSNCVSSRSANSNKSILEIIRVLYKYINNNNILLLNLSANVQQGLL